MKDHKRRILQHAKDKFFQFGFTKVTMDELAADLGMSKKTLYQHFSGKDQLLRDVARSMQETIETTITRIAGEEGPNEIEKLKQVVRCIAGTLARIQPAFFQDLRRHAPELWEEIEQFRTRMFTTFLCRFVETGVRNGTLRRDIDGQIFLHMYLQTVQTLITPEVLAHSSLTASQVFHMIHSILFEGVLTEEGRQHVSFSGKGVRE